MFIKWLTWYRSELEVILRIAIILQALVWVILILAGSVLAAEPWLKQIEWQKKPTAQTYDSDGKPYQPKRGQLAQPIIVVDSVRIAGTSVDLALNDVPRRGQLRVSPSVANNIHVISITRADTSGTPPTYTTELSQDLKTLTIKSSANDTGLIWIQYMVQ